MSQFNRRTFAKALLASGLGTGLGLAASPFAFAQRKARVVIVGGGIGGATVASQLKKAAPTLEVAVVEPQARITTCAGSNLFIGGVRTYEDLTHGLGGLKRLGIEVVQSEAREIDTARKTVTLASGTKLAYDRLVISPGIDFEFERIEGYDEAASELMPHAWRGGRQALLLKRQIEDMEDGDVVIIAAPSGFYRCPPAPYERDCMISHYIKLHKPKSKLILLDAKREFAKEQLFKDAFAKHYGGIIELYQSNEIDDFGVVQADPRNRTVTTKNGQKFKGAIVNLIPRQKAGAIAVKAGLAERGWCPVDPTTFGSLKAKDVFVVGDSVMADPMPKSGFAANSQAKLVAATIAAELVGAQKFAPRLRNTCWSLLERANTVKIGASYAVRSGKIEVVNSFVSALDESALVRAKNTSEYLNWYKNMMVDSFGKAA